MVQGRRFEHLRKEHWLPAVLSDVNTDWESKEASNKSEEVKCPSRTERAQTGVLMRWRELGTTFVIPYEIKESFEMDPLVCNQPGHVLQSEPALKSSVCYQAKSPSSPVPENRFSYLWRQHFEQKSSSNKNLSKDAAAFIEVDASG